MGAGVVPDSRELPRLVEGLFVVIVDGWQLAFGHSRRWRRRVDGRWSWRKLKLMRH